MFKLRKRGLFLVVFCFIFLILISSIFAFSFFNNKNQLKVTGEHPFLLNGTWVEASELKIGDELININGEKIRITGIEDIVLDESVDVYNLEVDGYENFVTEGGLVVHNSNAPENYYYEMYELDWGKTSRNLAFTETNAGELEKISRENMVERIVIDKSDSRLAEIVNEAYSENFAHLPINPDADELRGAVFLFSADMGQKLPFLGLENIDAVKGQGNMKEFLYKYLTESEDYKMIPMLSDLGKRGNLDCTGQALTIRQSLGGKESGWELYGEFSPSGNKRVHTFIAKEFELSNGEKYFAIVDPTEISLTGRPLLVKSEDFVLTYPKIELMKP